MRYEVRDEGQALVVALAGEVDLETSPDARKVLLEAVAQNRPVLVDLSGVDYIDSSGVASLIEALQHAKRNGRMLALVSVSEASFRVLRLARLDKVFSVHATLEAGLTALD